jgi:hypothetical protein
MRWFWTRRVLWDHSLGRIQRMRLVCRILMGWAGTLLTPSVPRIFADGMNGWSTVEFT